MRSLNKHALCGCFSHAAAPLVASSRCGRTGALNNIGSKRQEKGVWADSRATPPWDTPLPARPDFQSQITLMRGSRWERPWSLVPFHSSFLSSRVRVAGQKARVACNDISFSCAVFFFGCLLSLLLFPPFKTAQESTTGSKRAAKWPISHVMTLWVSEMR